MKYRCKCGNESEIVYDSFRAGNRCRKCGTGKTRHKLNLAQVDVESRFKELGCVLLDTYVKSSSPMKYKCSCGTLSRINLNNLQRGRRCKECLRRRRSGPNNYQWIENREAKAERDLFKQRCYKLVAMALNITGKRKHTRTEEMLGYSAEDLRNHITSHPDWNALKSLDWHIDHIFPIKAFHDHRIGDVKIVNSLDNLRPMLGKDNIAKSGKYDLVEFVNWLNSKGITKRQ